MNRRRGQSKEPAPGTATHKKKTSTGSRKNVKGDAQPRKKKRLKAEKKGGIGLPREQVGFIRGERREREKGETKTGPISKKNKGGAKGSFNGGGGTANGLTVEEQPLDTSKSN